MAVSLSSCVSEVRSISIVCYAVCQCVFTPGPKSEVTEDVTIQCSCAEFTRTDVTAPVCSNLLDAVFLQLESC